jgi:hypothetical protein
MCQASLSVSDAPRREAGESAGRSRFPSRLASRDVPLRRGRESAQSQHDDRGSPITDGKSARRSWKDSQHERRILNNCKTASSSSSARGRPREHIVCDALGFGTVANTAFRTWHGGRTGRPRWSRRRPSVPSDVPRRFWSLWRPLAAAEVASQRRWVQVPTRPRGGPTQPLRLALG